MQDRETLEAQALRAVSVDLYYELTDCVDSMSDNELLELLAS